MLFSLIIDAGRITGSEYNKRGGGRIGVNASPGGYNRADRRRLPANLIRGLQGTANRPVNAGVNVMTMENSVNTEKIVQDLKVVVADAEELLRATASQA
ncbi:MAG TPA: DUF883 domain-containing protein, partial [Burkholderiales bacterium]|nr:DUF883 domain-containing protein [Burkholderiales bacterium]